MVDTRYNPDNGEAEWKEQGADTWHPFSSINPSVIGSVWIARTNTGSGYSRSGNITVPNNIKNGLLLICTGIDNSTIQDTSVSVSSGTVIDTIHSGSPSYFCGSEAINVFVKDIEAGTLTVTCTNNHSPSSSTNYRVTLIDLTP